MQGFSLATVFADFRTMLANRWPLLLALVAAVTLLNFVSGNVFISFVVDMSDEAAAWSRVASRLAWEVILALYIGVVSWLALTTGPARTSLRAAFAQGVRSLPAILLVAFLVWLPRGLLMIDPVVMVLIGDDPEAGSLRVAVASMAVGLVQALIAAYLVVVATAAVSEDLGPAAAIRRGLVLTADRRWLAVGLWIAGTVPIHAGQPLYFVFAQNGTIMPDWFPTLTTAVFWLVKGAATLFFAACYLELKRVVDGPDETSAAAVFD